MIHITIETENAAFCEGYEGEEVARILREMARAAEDGDFNRTIKDINGNTCGRMEEN